MLPAFHLLAELRRSAEVCRMSSSQQCVLLIGFVSSFLAVLSVSVVVIFSILTVSTWTFVEVCVPFTEISHTHFYVPVAIYWACSTASRVGFQFND